MRVQRIRKTPESIFFQIHMSKLVFYADTQAWDGGGLIGRDVLTAIGPTYEEVVRTR
jgi:hypothetical protein